jgi:hypothetical protein
MLPSRADRSSVSLKKVEFPGTRMATSIWKMAKGVKKFSFSFRRFFL